MRLPLNDTLLRFTLHRTVSSTNTKEVEDAVRQMIAYARGLTVAARETRAQLLHSVLHHDADQKLKSLSELVAQFPRSEETKRAAAAALLDASPSLRLRAAIFLDDEGLEIVEGLIVDEDVPGELRLLGLRHRSRAVDRSRYAELIDTLLASPAIEIREAAIYAYVDLAGENALERLTAMLPDAPPKLVESIARALGRIGSQNAEPILLELLASRHEAVLVAAAQALSRVGTTAALSRLLAILYERPGLEELTKDILRAAIAVLKDDRRPNVGGHLSMVAELPEARGGLSLQDRASALSFPEED